MQTGSKSEVPRPSRLWRQMSNEQRMAAADAFWRDGDLAPDQAQAVAAIARHINFRPRSVAALPLDKRSRHLAGLPALPEPLIGRLLISYHLGAQRPMMAAFLEQLGISHDDGLIVDEETPPPSPARLARAARELAGRYPRADVALYLGTLFTQDPVTWEGLAGLPELSSASADA